MLGLKMRIMQRLSWFRYKMWVNIEKKKLSEFVVLWENEVMCESKYPFGIVHVVSEAFLKGENPITFVRLCPW